MAYIAKWKMPNGTTYDIKSAICSGNSASATEIHSPFYYSENMLSQSMTADDLFGSDRFINKLSCGFMQSSAPWNDWSDVLYFTGYCKWGATQIATQYNATYPRVAIRKYVQGSTQGYGQWNEFIMASNVGSQSVNYATKTTYLYADDSPYQWNNSAPYYTHMSYNTHGDNRWYLRVYPETPRTIAVDYAYNSSTSDDTYRLNINNTMGLANCLQYIQTSQQTSGNDLPASSWYHCIKMNHGTGDTYYKRLLAFNFWGTNAVYTAYADGTGAHHGWSKFWLEGDAVTSAVWNDYAEYRQSTCKEPGYVLQEVGDDTLVKTSERLAHFAGVSSDTWGFAEGETDEAKTPIAVAGRVLVYTYRPRDEYKPGMAVCAAPDGTVDIMTHEEEKEWPTRIVGTVSCVPQYDEWGGGENADRDPVKVDGRIWIKVR